MLPSHERNLTAEKRQITGRWGSRPCSFSWDFSLFSVARGSGLVDPFRAVKGGTDRSFVDGDDDAESQRKAVKNVTVAVSTWSVCWFGSGTG